MAYSKIILNGETLMDVTSDTVDAGNLLSGKTATKNSGAKVTGNIATKSSSDLTVSGATITAPVGYYSAAASKAVATGTATTPAKTITTNPTITLSTTTGIVTATYAGSSSITPTVSAGYVTTGTAGTISTTGTSTYQLTVKSAADMTVAAQSVTAPAGYYSTAATKAITTTTHPNPTATIASSTGVVTATHTQTTGYVTSGTTTGTLNLTTQAATTYNTSTADQTIASYRWLTGIQTIKSVTTSNLTAANIASGVVVKVGDANNASRITQITGTYAPKTSYLTIYPSTQMQYIEPPDGYDGYNFITAYSVTTSNLTAANIASGVTVKVGYTNGSQIAQVTGTYAPTTSSLTVTPTETSQTFNATGVYGYKPVTVNAISSTYVGTGIARKSSADTTFTSTTGTFTAPVGYYSAVATNTITTQAAQTITPTKASQYINSYRWLTGSQTIEPIPASYIIPSGTSTITSNGTYDVTNYASASVSVAGGSFYSIYRAIGNSNYLNISQYSDVQDWANSYSRVSSMQFAGLCISGELTFNNLISSNEAQGVFGSVYSNTAYAYYSNQGAYNFPNLSIIGSTWFYCNYNISKITASVCNWIRGYAFYRCENLTSISFSSCNTIEQRAFYYCTKLTSLNFSLCTSIGSNAFEYNKELTFISFPVCQKICSSAFIQCSKLLSVDFPKCTVISGCAFQSCTSLSIANFPSCLSIGASAFYSCTSLTTINFSKCTSINTYAFYYCTALTSLNFPSCTTISGAAFSNCTALSVASFPVCSVIGTSAFYNCYNLLSLYLLGSSVVSLLSQNAFTKTPISGYTTSTGGVYGSIYVPASLYNSYLTATNWSLYSARIVSV